MPYKACNQNGPRPSSKTGRFQTVYDAVAALTTQDLNRLEQIAETKLRQLVSLSAIGGLRPLGDPQDFIAEAIQTLLEGEQTPGKGRTTNPRHLVSFEAVLELSAWRHPEPHRSTVRGSLLIGQHMSVDMGQDTCDTSRILTPRGA